MRNRGDFEESGQEVLRLVAQLDHTIDLLQDTDWGQLDKTTRNLAYRRLEQARAKLTIVDVDYLSASNDGERVEASSSAVRNLSDTINISFRESRKRLRNAVLLQKGVGAKTSGGMRTLPDLRDRAVRGNVNADSVENLHRAIAELPVAARRRIREVEPDILEAAAATRPDDLRAIGPQLRVLLNAESPYTDRDRHEHRSVTLSHPNKDNMSYLEGHVTPHLGAMLRRLWADHARPGSLMELADGDTDPRTPEQRRHDALEAALHAGYGSCRTDKDIAATAAQTDFVPIDEDSTEPMSTEPQPHLRPVQRLRPARGTTSIVAVTTIAELAKCSGVVTTDVGTTMSIVEMLRCADFGDLHLSVLDPRGQTMEFARSRRCGSTAQYLALVAEEGMSTAPYTSAPPAYCDVHHIEPWKRGGFTDLSNLTLVDSIFHARVDDDGTDDTRWSSTRYPGTLKVAWLPPKTAEGQATPTFNQHPFRWLSAGSRITRRHYSREELGTNEDAVTTIVTKHHQGALPAEIEREDDGSSGHSPPPRGPDNPADTRPS
ncbi:HNH endonuclease [Corynebacterium sp. TAE3-ERU12]|uniref:HNH endonuclease signature motif containing protein n=1 Tax=Corynebacterium sp. TAE3-ERU12 TaxID=2849491 RepID=UPI001C463B24|nr:HNH endonuclease signature motif containing protein [Corynebacterium sp. TAE3-ERU12]MBV7296016.1 HNH endonuclease [Corynebacterium sp. TAE3-ERU12]